MQVHDIVDRVQCICEPVARLGDPTPRDLPSARAIGVTDDTNTYQTPTLS